MAAQRSLSRRGFLGHAGGVAAATAAAGTLAALPLGEVTGAPVAAADSPSGVARANQAYNLRVTCARTQRAVPLPAHPTNGDEALYATTRIGNYTKGLPHNALGEVDPAAFSALLTALASGNPADFEAIPLGGTAKFADPQSSYAYVLEGADSACLAAPPSPAFSSAREAAEMAELYWYSLVRDLPFAQFATDPLIARAAADLSRLSGFGGPKDGGAVTPATIFRAGLAGEMTGPYVSQFLWLPIAYGVMTVPQLYPIAPSKEYLTTYDTWLTVQNGGYTAPKPGKAPAKPAPTHYMIAGRDLATFLHADFTYQAYLNAALILNKMTAAPDAANPYLNSKTQAGVGTFGIHHLVDLVARVADAAVKACWYQKWLVHRSVRPEEFGGNVHNHKTGAAKYPIHTDLLSTSTVLDAIYQKYGTYLLPMAYPEGCPMHPSYPAGHPAVTGACVTVLKAWFDETFVLPAPVVASPDGRALLPYKGAPLTVGGELNKLAGNLLVGRSFGGVHWRSDNDAGLRLGEAVAISILADQRLTVNQKFAGFSLTKFDGTTVTV
jgi:hypothetical protein